MQADHVPGLSRSSHGPVGCRPHARTHCSEGCRRVRLKYAGGPAMPSSAASKPPVASKPVFTPTQVGGGGTAFNPLGRSRAKPQSQHVDEDGWGTDAPQVTRTQLEKVQPAYQPTKVNMAELTSQRREPSRVQATPRQDESSDVVKGGYQPVGKVDIAALRRGAKSSAEDRPIPVKGAYEPTGKVDIAAIRAKAQAGPPSRVSPAATGVSSRGDDDEMPRPLADRSSAFTQSERLTSMPKPKVGNKFGASASFAGTKAPSPAGFGAKPVASAAPVGSASKTFADEGGKTPAQIWAEKKAREGGGAKSPTAAAPSPMPSQPSGDGGWKSGYTGKSWAPVQTTRTGQSDTGNLSNQPTGEELPEEEPTSPAGGVGVLKDRFKGAVPMGAPSARPVPEPQAPPPMDFSSKPNAGARGVPIPGLPSRSTEPEDEVPAEQHQRLPSPPRQPRNPSPESAGSPVRIAMPVARTAEPELSPPAEPEQALPIRSLDKAAQAARGILPEPPTQAEDPARGAAEAAAASTFGRAATRAEHGGGKRAVVQYDYEKAEDNEIELREGEQVTNIDMVDDDWWMGQNSAGETGLFPSNYVELVEEDDHAVDEQPPPPLPAHPNVAQHDEVEEEASVMPAQTSGATATALYDYDAAEDNELSFPEGAKIEGVVCRLSIPCLRGFVRTNP